MQAGFPLTVGCAPTGTVIDLGFLKITFSTNFLGRLGPPKAQAMAQHALHWMTTVSDTSLVFKMPRFQSAFGACRRCLTAPASSPRLQHLHTSTIISSISRKQKPCSNPGSRYPLIKTRKPLNYGLYKVITVSRRLLQVL